MPGFNPLPTMSSRHFASADVTALARRMHWLDCQTGMDQRLDTVPHAPAGDFDGQTIRQWLRSRAMELAWADRMVSRGPDEPPPASPPEAHSRRAAVRLAKELIALTISTSSRSDARAHAWAAAGLLRHIEKVVALIEAHVDPAGRRPS